MVSPAAKVCVYSYGDKLSVACITNKTFQPNKIGPDDMQSHPLHFGQ